MVLHAHFKKHIIALGGWLLMYTSGPPPGLAKDHLFSGFFLLPSLRNVRFYGELQKIDQGILGMSEPSPVRLADVLS